MSSGVKKAVCGKNSVVVQYKPTVCCCSHLTTEKGCFCLFHAGQSLYKTPVDEDHLELVHPLDSIDVLLLVQRRPLLCLSQLLLLLLQQSQARP